LKKCKYIKKKQCKKQKVCVFFSPDFPMRHAARVSAWATAAGGAVGVPLALAAGKPGLAVAFYACAHSCLSRVSRVHPDALAALAWGACAAGVCASTSGFSTCALQLVPAIAAHAHGRAVHAFHAELVLVVKAGRSAAVDCARGLAQRIRAGANTKTTLDDIATESAFLIAEHVGKGRRNETDYKSAFKARQTAAGVLLFGVGGTLLFAAAGAPVTAALAVAAVAGSAAASAAFAVSETPPSHLACGDESGFADPEQGGDRAAVAVRAGHAREGYAVHTLALCACAGALLDADPLAGLAATGAHCAGAVAFASRGAIAAAAPAFLCVLVLVLVIGGTHP
jgi:hypothetical protein